MLVVVKMVEYSLDYGRQLAKSAASVVDEPPDRRVVCSVLSKISKHYRALTSTIQRSISCFMSAWLSF
jgi:hypothetical protein